MIGALLATLVGRAAAGPPPGGDPAEWAGLTPYLDWDPDVSATADGSGNLLTLVDTSGNGRDAAPAIVGSYPFADLPMPKVIASTAFGGGLSTLEFRGNPNVDSYAPTILFPVMPAGPCSVLVVLYSDMPDHALMTGGGGAPPAFTNNYAISGEGYPIGLYADGAASRAWGGWMDPGYGEPARGADFASTPHVVLLTSSGESSPGAADSTTRLYANALTPSVLSGRAPLLAARWLLGSYQGWMSYSTQGEIARVIVWDVELTPGVQSTAAINASASKYSLTVSP